MPWQELRIPAASRLAASLSDALMDLGALSVSIEDAWAGSSAEQPIFGEPGEVSGLMWEKSIVIALLEADADPALLVAAAAAAVGAPLPDYAVVPVAEQDWVRLTQAQFDPIQVSARLWITPTWHEPAVGAINLSLDPGLAFGTGSHPTTWLCLQWLDETLPPGATVLDYGCGSGILAVAAKLLGAGKVDGVDIDPQALIASRQNAEQNNVAIDFHPPEGVLAGPYDVVVANILTNPLRLLAPLFAAQCRPGGRLCLSGILSEQAEEIIATYAPWFRLDGQAEREGWVRLTGVRVDAAG